MTGQSQRGESELAERIGSSGRTVAVAESLTSGRLAAALGAASGASEWFRGGVVAYSTEVKRHVLGMPDCSPVCAAAARAMAEGARSLLRADVAVAVTGVGGPGPQDGEPPGVVWFAVAGEDGTRSECHRFAGDPGKVVDLTVRHALELLCHTVSGG